MASSSTAARFPTPNERGERIVDESFYVIFNAHHEPLDFTMPDVKWGTEWGVVFDTYEESIVYMREEDTGRSYKAGEIFQVHPWSLVLLRRTKWE